jgi:hypothetical protein
VKRAAEVFAITEWGSDCPYVEKVWVAGPGEEASFLSVAETRWQAVVTALDGCRRLTVRGPSTRAVATPVPEGAEFFGIVFSLGTFSPAVPLATLVDRAVDGSAWAMDGVPTPGTADAFVDRLVRRGLLVRDREITDAVDRDASGPSTRSLQRRILRATGLTRGTIRQIDRAGEAARSLHDGWSPAEVASALGYADQPHLTRSLRRFVGVTPRQVGEGGEPWSASGPIAAARV